MSECLWGIYKYALCYGFLSPNRQHIRLTLLLENYLPGFHAVMWYSLVKNKVIMMHFNRWLRIFLSLSACTAKLNQYVAMQQFKNNTVLFVLVILLKRIFNAFLYLLSYALLEANSMNKKLRIQTHYDSDSQNVFDCITSRQQVQIFAALPIGREAPPTCCWEVRHHEPCSFKWIINTLLSILYSPGLTQLFSLPL